MNRELKNRFNQFKTGLIRNLWRIWYKMFQVLNFLVVCQRIKKDKKHKYKKETMKMKQFDTLEKNKNPVFLQTDYNSNGSHFYRTRKKKSTSFQIIFPEINNQGVIDI